MSADQNKPQISGRQLFDEYRHDMAAEGSPVCPWDLLNAEAQRKWNDAAVRVSRQREQA